MSTRGEVRLFGAVVLGGGGGGVGLDSRSAGLGAAVKRVVCQDLGVSGCLLPPMDVVDVSSALSAPWDGGEWQAAYDEAVFGVGEELKLTFIYFILCYIHCLYCCLPVFAVCLASLATSTRGFSPLPHRSLHSLSSSSPASSCRRRGQQTYASTTPIAADTSHRSMRSCAPFTASSFGVWYSVPPLLPTTGPPAACHPSRLASPRQSTLQLGPSGSTSRVAARHRPRRGRWWGGMRRQLRRCEVHEESREAPFILTIGPQATARSSQECQCVSDQSCLIETPFQKIIIHHLMFLLSISHLWPIEDARRVENHSQIGLASKLRPKSDMT